MTRGMLRLRYIRMLVMCAAVLLMELVLSQKGWAQG
jgi:hypothetical protein